VLHLDPLNASRQCFEGICLMPTQGVRVECLASEEPKERQDNKEARTRAHASANFCILRLLGQCQAHNGAHKGGAEKVLEQSTAKAHAARYSHQLDIGKVRILQHARPAAGNVTGRLHAPQPHIRVAHVNCVIPARYAHALNFIQ